jgi:membrane protease YdiL (CAAX protease family)
MEHLNEEFLETTEPIFDGSWERAHRNITTAAFLGLIITGVVYFYAQAIITGILFFLNVSRTHEILKEKTFIERISYTMTVLKNPLRYSLIVSQFLFMLVPIVWIIKRWHTIHVLSYARIARISLLELIVAVTATVCFVPVSGSISEYFIRKLNIPDFLAQLHAQIFTSYSSQELLWLIVVVCITPAVCEEMLFRGYVQRTLERTLGMKSVFITGIIFGLFHMQPLNLVSLSFLGILIGYFYYRSKSLVPCIFAHFTNNFLAVLSLYKTQHEQTVFRVFDFEITFLGGIAALLLTGALVFVYHQITKKNFVEQLG